MKIGFGILLEEESHNFVRQIELELCHKFELNWGLRQSPHVTIKAPFETDKLEPFSSYLESLAKEIEPFDIELEGFNYFEPTVIFLDVKENDSLRKLHLRILEDMKKLNTEKIPEEFSRCSRTRVLDISPGDFEGEKFKFHSTLAFEDLTEQKFKEAKEYLSKYSPKFKFKAKTLGLFYNIGEAGWIIARRISLKS